MSLAPEGRNHPDQAGQQDLRHRRMAGKRSYSCTHTHTQIEKDILREEGERARERSREKKVRWRETYSERQRSREAD